MSRTELAAAIRRLIDEDRFDEAAPLLPEYAHAVAVEGGASAEDAFRQARDFVRAALVTLRARRAHHARDLAEARRHEAYFAGAGAARAFDCEG